MIVKERVEYAFPISCYAVSPTYIVKDDFDFIFSKDLNIILKNSPSPSP